MAKFELVSKYEGQNYLLPQRETKLSAGYDLKAAEDVVIPSGFKPVLIHTGIKVKLANDQVLILANRSSNALKRGLIIPNGIGVIDADYYNNPDNEGEIMGMFIHLGNDDYVIHKGSRIMQGIISNYSVAEDDQANDSRVGGFGSTDGYRLDTGRIASTIFKKFDEKMVARKPVPPVEERNRPNAK